MRGLYSESTIHKQIREKREDRKERIKQTYGNPSSLHTSGQYAKVVLEQARADIAATIRARPREIIFTSGGSEADNQAIRSAAELGKRRGKMHIISSAFEHHAVLHVLEKLRSEGFHVTLLDVHEDGIVRPESCVACDWKAVWISV